MGQLLKVSIPTKRLALYLMFLGLIPLVAVCGYFIKERKQWKTISEEITATTYLSTLKAQKQAINNLVRKKYGKSDPLYLEHRLQGFTPLSKEIDSLEKLTRSPNYTGSEAIEKRLAFLKESNSQITFLEKGAQTGDGLRETFEVLTHPVEASTEDVRYILDVLEGEQPMQPQIIVRDFQLTRKVKPSGNEVFDLHLSLIKREFEPS